MHRRINHVAVLGSGIMGSRIACHFANAGIKVLLLDIAPKPTEEDLTKGTDTGSKLFRNRIVNESLKKAIQSNPSPLYSKSFADRIRTGNLTDDISAISEADWIIEVVIEKLEIKQQLLEQVERFKKPSAIVTSNTSGIPISDICEGRTDAFKRLFCGTHFFNPPRYLRLLEIIPTEHTDPEIIKFLMEFGDIKLGKETVLCKDTPAFIANRIGVYAIMSLLHHVSKTGMSVEEVDKLTGPVLGRPKSATFRTTDVVGLDTMVHVANGLFEKCINDTERNTFRLPDFVSRMVQNNWLGDKTGQGFYKKQKDANGKSEILALDLSAMEYRPQNRVKFATLETAKTIENLEQRLKVLFNGTDKAGEFYREIFACLFSYVSNCLPEISDEIYKVDQALKAGFGWEAGPFEMWNAIGLKAGVQAIESIGKKAAPWVYEMISNGHESFYSNLSGSEMFYDIGTKNYLNTPGSGTFIILKNIQDDKTVFRNQGCTLFDIGDGVLNLEFHTKMNAIGGEVLEGVNKAIEIAEKDFEGLVIANDGTNFSAGANLALVFMFAVEQEYEELDFAIRAFQNTNMRVRYSSIPVVVAPHGLTLGGGCEMLLHADKVVAAAETYTGLVEFGVGLIPGGGGTKEFAKRISETLEEGDIETNALKNRFLTIATARVSTSAQEAFELGILKSGRDQICMNRRRLISQAKSSVLDLSRQGYQMPMKGKDIKVLGRTGLGMVQAGANSMFSGNYMSEHDKLISEKLGHVICGGNLSAPTFVSEQYLLDLEREAFLSLCGHKKTLERIQSILTSGKPLRN